MNLLRDTGKKTREFRSDKTSAEYSQQTLTGRSRQERLRRHWDSSKQIQFEFVDKSKQTSIGCSKTDAGKIDTWVQFRHQ